LPSNHETCGEVTLQSRDRTCTIPKYLRTPLAVFFARNVGKWHGFSEAIADQDHVGLRRNLV
jgi:hypothetical protein